MLHSKLFTVLRTLSKEEVASFHRYLKKEHGNELIALSLFAYIRKFHPHYREEKKLEMAYAYHKVFGAQIGKNRKSVSNTLSDLNIWLKTFLLSEKATKDSFASRFLWLAVLRERGLQTEFSKQAMQLESEARNMPKKSAMDYLKEVTINHFVYFHLALEKFPAEENNGSGLDLFYVLAKFKLACEKANFRNVRAEKMEPEPLPESFDNFLMQIQPKDPLLLLYREVYQLLVKHRSESFDRLETLLPKYADKIAPEEMNLILRYLHNYATSQIRKGKEEFWKRTHQLNKLSLEFGIFAKEGLMAGAQFNNIVSVACYTNDTGWARSFVVSHGSLLQEDIREEIVLLANATIHFENKDFHKVLDLLANRNFRSQTDMIRSKALILRSFYELQVEEDTILSFCLTFENFLRHHREFKSEAVEATKRFILIFKKILLKKTEKDRILHLIAEDKPLYFKAWLLDKMSAYENKFAAPKRKR